MNLVLVIDELNRLCSHWEVEIRKPYLTDKSEWARGVIYGIRLAIKAVCHIAERTTLFQQEQGISKKT